MRRIATLASAYITHWFVCACSDYALCWAISISWEVIEVAFLHMLPNFAECWWDQWILDVMLMNGLGIFVGHKLCDMLEVRRYEWSGVRDIPALTGKVKRVFLQFTPERWTKVRYVRT
jgi:phosphatidylserine synthase 1